MKTNLTTLAKQLAAIDRSGEVDLNIVQIRECLAALGQHLRTLTTEQALETFLALTKRAGLKSKNPKL